MSRIAHPRHPILIVDDEYYILLNVSGILKANGIDNLITCQDSREVMKILSEREIGVVLLDLTMPHLSGQELLPRIREEYPQIPVIIITGTAEVETAVECMKLGVFDYLVKAIEESKLLATVRRAVELRDLRDENLALRDHLFRQSLQQPQSFEGIVYSDEKMKAVLLYVESIARSDQTALITGETGVGKEVVARAIHSLSGRSGEFVAVNVAGLDDTMFSDTLFGHLKGAYTGAGGDRKGLIAAAAGGTLLLDEIGDLSNKSQVSLLRLLESREYYPLGSDLARRTDARIIVATNRKLRQAVLAGAFRKDLYYRLQTHHLHVPALRDRPHDLEPLVSHFLPEACNEYGKEIPPIPRDLLALLRRYSFPGNIRELRSMIFDAVSRHPGGPLGVQSFEQAVQDNALLEPASGQDTPLTIGEGFPTLREATEFLIGEALRRSGGNQAQAARLLGITPPALSRRLSRQKQA
ncbi:MAG: sigma-54-dependent Fis family transcriptional regulator [Spirochaetales bacterium]|nr:sigma-54-dependent Fis family transcriptional regulator [Spirochaetales bacterium]